MEAREGSQAPLGRRAGRAWAGKGEAGRLGCETRLAAGSLGELQQASHVPCALAFLSGKREDLVLFLSFTVGVMKLQSMEVLL